MKKLFAFLFVALLFVGVQDVWAQGDVGSRECGAAQDACLDAIAPDEFKNHGKKVSACAKASNTDAGFDITDECHSCIVNQVARRIPVDEQENCGREFVAASCDDLVTEIDMWGFPAKGVDLRAYTNSTLHWIGCASLGCEPVQSLDFNYGTGVR